jgi:hypothetical protein
MEIQIVTEGSVLKRSDGYIASEAAFMRKRLTD